MIAFTAGFVKLGQACREAKTHKNTGLIKHISVFLKVDR